MAEAPLSVFTVLEHRRHRRRVCLLSLHAQMGVLVDWLRSACAAEGRSNELLVKLVREVHSTVTLPSATVDSGRALTVMATEFCVFVAFIFTVPLSTVVVSASISALLIELSVKIYLSSQLSTVVVSAKISALLIELSVKISSNTLVKRYSRIFLNLL